VTTTSTQGRPADVHAAIEMLYRAFSRYPLPAESTYSRHTTISEEDVRRIRAKPLRALSGTDLGKFAMKALNTWGDASEFRHYLPRLFELVVDEPNWTDIPTLFGKLSTAEWRGWPSEEQRAVESYINTLIASALRADVNVSFRNVALGASNAGVSFANLSSVWSSTSGTAPVVQLAHVVVLERNDLLRTGEIGHRWNDEAKRVLSALIASSDTRRRLEEAFVQLSDPVQADAVSNALGVVEMMRQLPV
jgi:hypothetical protein